MRRILGAEAFGTFWLVFGGCGAAVLASYNIAFAGVALAFGLTVVTMAYAVGGISGGHFNPAITLGLAVSGRFDKKNVAAYWAAQVVGAVLAAAVLAVIAKGIKGGYSFADPAGGGPGFATNGYGDRSPNGYNLASVVVAEIVTTALFVLIILGVTAKKSIAEFAGLAIGLCLTLIHLITIPVSNTSVNPARSIGPALFVGTDALAQLPVFIIAPLVGGALGAALWRFVLAGPEEFELASGVSPD